MGLWADLRYSIRSLTRTPVVASALLFTIALGIGSNAAVVGFVRGLVKWDLPVPGIESMVSLFSRDQQDAFVPVSYDAFLSVKTESNVFDSAGAARESRAAVVVNGRSSVMAVAAVTSELATTFQLSLDGGIVASHRVWYQELGGKADVRGERILIDGVESHVAGVALEWARGSVSRQRGRSLDAADEASFQGTRSQQPDVLGDWAAAAGRVGTSRPGRGELDAERRGRDRGAALHRHDALGLDRHDAHRPDPCLRRRRGGVPDRLRQRRHALAVARLGPIARDGRSASGSAPATAPAARPPLAVIQRRDLRCRRHLLGVLLALWTTKLVPAFFFDEDAEQLAFVPDLTGIAAAAAACLAITIVCGLVPLFEIRHDYP